ncbi:hypothetical protein ACQJ8E_00725 [Helicobacter pylori]
MYILGSFYAVFVWGENLELLGFLVVVGGYLKKRCFIACFIILVMVLFKLALSMSD